MRIGWWKGLLLGSQEVECLVSALRGAGVYRLPTAPHVLPIRDP